MRTFIAIEIPKRVQESLRSLSDRLQTKIGPKSIRWTPIENMHLTLKFFKKISMEDVEFVSKILQEVAKEFSPFELGLGSLGNFPNPQRPRVIWLGLEDHPRLIALQEDLNEAMVGAGYPAERRPFSPHLTLGRLRRNVPAAEFAGINQVVENEKVDLRRKIEVREAVLFRSELKASGAEHTKLSNAKLGSK